MLNKMYISRLHFKTQLKSWKKKFFLIISNREGWHYLPVKELSALLRGITSKDDDEFYNLNCLHSFKTKNRLESHEKLWI